jgi:transcription antitermination factor NusG
VPHTNRIDYGAESITPEWFAFRVRPRHEKRAALYLLEKGEECFVPLIRATRTWAKRVAQVDLPLFSGYVFCRSHRFGLLPILKTPGIVDVIRAGNSPVPIPNSEISALERAISASIPIEPCPYVEVGQKVEIRSGPLTGVVGIVSDRRKSGHLIVSVSLLRRSVLVHIDIAHLCVHGTVPACLNAIESHKTLRNSLAALQ